jgi:hypothetical protein
MGSVSWTVLVHAWGWPADVRRDARPAPFDHLPERLDRRWSTRPASTSASLGVHVRVPEAEAICRRRTGPNPCAQARTCPSKTPRRPHEFDYPWGHIRYRKQRQKHRRRAGPLRAVAVGQCRPSYSSRDSAMRCPPSRTLVGALTIVAPLVIASTVIGSMAAGATSNVRIVGCGGDRWDVRNLLDEGSARIDYSTRATSIPFLRRLSRPPNVGPRTPRRAPVEDRTYRLHASLVRTRRSSPSEVELVIRAVKGGQLMTVVFSYTHQCLDVLDGPKGDDIHAAAHAFLGDCGPLVPTRQPTRLSGTATLGGVGYFALGSSRRAFGAAPNGVQLHPVLEFASLNCRRG